MERNKECCANCRYRFDIKRFDYSQGGCKHTPMEGYICMGFATEREAVWMVGNDVNSGMCECYAPLKNR